MAPWRPVDQGTIDSHWNHIHYSSHSPILPAWFDVSPDLGQLGSEDRLFEECPSWGKHAAHAPRRHRHLHLRQAVPTGGPVPAERPQPAALAGAHLGPDGEPGHAHRLGGRGVRVRPARIRSESGRGRSPAGRGAVWTEQHGGPGVTYYLQDSVLYDGWERVRAWVSRRASSVVARDTFQFDRTGNLKTKAGM